MNLTSTVFTKLLSLSLGHETKFDISLEEVDWPAVVQHAMSQGLDAVAFDGLQVLYERRPELTEVLDASLGETKFDWLGLTLQAEQDYEAYRGKLRELASFYGQEGFKMLVLKGYGLSLDYPVPAHRPTGDIDVYLYGWGEEADERVKEKLGVAVKQNEDKHSTFQFQGLSVENHATFLKVVEHRSLRPIETALEVEAENALVVSVEGVDIFVPTPMMNALFLPCHMASHFVFGGIPLKQLVDWAVFLEQHGKDVNWTRVRLLAEGAGYYKLVRALNGIVMDHFGVPSECTPDWGRDLPLEERIWQDCLKPRKDLAARSVWEKLKDYFAARWKFRLAYRESMFLNFFRHGWASIRIKYLPKSRSVWG